MPETDNRPRRHRLQPAVDSSLRRLRRRQVKCFSTAIRLRRSSSGWDCQEPICCSDGDANWSVSRVRPDIWTFGATYHPLPYRLSPGTTNAGFVHMMRRHMAQFYDRTKQATYQTTGLWPHWMSPDDVLTNLRKSLQLMTPPTSEDFATQFAREVLLDTGIRVQVVIREGFVHTFYLLSGPGVTTVQELIAKSLI